MHVDNQCPVRCRLHRVIPLASVFLHTRLILAQRSSEVGMQSCRALIRGHMIVMRSAQGVGSAASVSVFSYGRRTRRAALADSSAAARDACRRKMRCSDSTCCAIAFEARSISSAAARADSACTDATAHTAAPINQYKRQSSTATPWPWHHRNIGFAQININLSGGQGPASLVDRRTDVRPVYPLSLKCGSRVNML